MLQGLEDGDLDSHQVYRITEQLDPILVYFLIRYLREKYPPQKPTSAGVVQRLIELSSEHDDLVKRTKEAEQDPMKEWFDESYDMHEFFSSAENFVDTIVDKLEG